VLEAPRTINKETRGAWKTPWQLFREAGSLSSAF
jgi:hypothetical protein